MVSGANVRSSTTPTIASTTPRCVLVSGSITSISRFDFLLDTEDLPVGTYLRIEGEDAA
jgi:hypothetical protein